MNTPLTFLVDDFFRTKAMNQTNYFRLNKENAKDGRDHYFYFEVRLQNQFNQVRFFKYIRHEFIRI